jgi:hypothetical protein
MNFLQVQSGNADKKIDKSRAIVGIPVWNGQLPKLDDAPSHRHHQRTTASTDAPR